MLILTTPTNPGVAAWTDGAVAGIPLTYASGGQATQLANNTSIKEFTTLALTVPANTLAANDVLNYTFVASAGSGAATGVQIGFRFTNGTTTTFLSDNIPAPLNDYQNYVVKLTMTLTDATLALQILVPYVLSESDNTVNPTTSTKYLFGPSFDPTLPVVFTPIVKFGAASGITAYVLQPSLTVNRP